MSEGAGAKPPRRPLVPTTFDSFDAVDADVARLASAGYAAAGRWTLGQVCWHLAHTMEGSIQEPADAAGEPTSEQRAMKEKFFAMVFAPAGLPPDVPLAVVPPADAGPDQIARLRAACVAFEAAPHARFVVGRCGPVAKSEIRRLHLAHAAHHLSFLVPAAPSKVRPTLRFADEAAMLGDIASLRTGYSAGGRWTLAQICWHLSLAFSLPLVAATREEADAITPAQRERQARWDHYIAHVAPPPGFQAPPNLVPPPGVGEDAVEALVALLREFESFRGDFVTTAAGAMPTARARGFLLAHGAHHLSYLSPTKGASNA